MNLCDIAACILQSFMILPIFCNWLLHKTNTAKDFLVNYYLFVPVNSTDILGTVFIWQYLQCLVPSGSCNSSQHLLTASGHLRLCCLVNSEITEMFNSMWTGAFRQAINLSETVTSTSCSMMPGVFGIIELCNRLLFANSFMLRVQLSTGNCYFQNSVSVHVFNNNLVMSKTLLLRLVKNSKHFRSRWPVSVLHNEFIWKCYKLTGCIFGQASWFCFSEICFQLTEI
jgi:hypothetical protein